MHKSSKAPTRPKERTLRQALAWLLVAALAPLLLGSSLFLWTHWNEEREASLTRLRDMASALESAVERELALDQTALQVLATSPEIDAHDWPAFHMLATQAATLRPGRWVLLGDRAGQTLINTLVPLGTPLPSFSAREAGPGKRVEWQGRSLPFFDTAVLGEPLRSARPRISGLFVGPVRQGPVIALSVPVKRGSEVPFSIAFAYPPEAFVELMERQPATPGVIKLIIDAEGKIIARSQDPRGTIGRQAPAPFDQAAQLPKQGLIQTLTLDGVPAFFAHRRSELSNWTIAVGMPRADLLAPARRSLVVWLTLLAAIVATATILAHRFWRQVALPLTRLAAQPRPEIDGAEVSMPATDIREINALCAALREAATAESARREEVARRLAVEQRERRLASQHADELAAADHRKDDFLAMLAHELRNPLAAITNAVAVMRKIPPADDRARTLQDVVERQVRQLARLVDDLLDVARINTGKIVLRKERLDLRQVAEDAAQVAMPAMDRSHHNFTVLQGDQPIWVDADEARLLQIIGNLLDNSAKYTDPGGNVTLSVGADGPSALVRVADTGRGIGPELLSHVFDLFTQGGLAGARAAGGLGIGLHVVKRLVEKHGGAVSVTSAGAGRGSVFEVRLPLAQQAEDDPADCLASSMSG